MKMFYFKDINKINKVNNFCNVKDRFYFFIVYDVLWMIFFIFFWIWYWDIYLLNNDNIFYLFYVMGVFLLKRIINIYLNIYVYKKCLLILLVYIKVIIFFDKRIK